MTEPRPRWAHLTPEQRNIAADLYERARPLIDRGLTVAEAIDIAPIQAGHLPRLPEPEPAERPEGGVL